MVRESKGSAFTLAILIGVFLQVVFAFADTAESPSKAAVEFSKAYYMLDESMKNRLCAELMENEDANPVNLYIQQKIDAHKR